MKKALPGLSAGRLSTIDLEIKAPLGLCNIVGSQATCVRPMRETGKSGALPLCPGFATPELPGLKSWDGEPGSTVPNCAPWRMVLHGSL